MSINYFWHQRDHAWLRTSSAVRFSDELTRFVYCCIVTLDNNTVLMLSRLDIVLTPAFKFQQPHSCILAIRMLERDLHLFPLKEP